MLKLINKKIIYLFCLVFMNCFEYEEKIFFKKNFSGSVYISYIVPLRMDKKSSLLKFLPIHEKDINQRINKSLFSNNLSVKNFSFQLIHDAEKRYTILPKYPRAIVSYTVNFSKPEELENILIGNFFSQRIGNSITIRREFKGVTPQKKKEPITVGEKKLSGEILRLLGDHSIHFQVFIPSELDCKTDRGTFDSGVLNYRLPLQDTIEKSGNKTWQYRLYLSK